MNRWQWFWLIVGFTYLLSPIDFIPDLIPGLGNLDDAGVIFFIIQKMLAAGQTKIVSAAPKLTAR